MHRDALKVTFCSHDSPETFGGPFAWIERLLPELRSQGIEARCLFLTWGEGGACLAALRGHGFDCPAVPCHGLTEDRVKWILERLRENPPDVFVPNLVLPGYFAARWVRASGIPTVGVAHSDDELYRGLQETCVFGPEGFRLSALVCVSKALEEEALGRGPQQTIVRRIPCGAPLAPATVRRPRSNLRLAYVGRLAEKQKRISEVARAFCLVAREVPGTEAEIYGDGPDRAAVEGILASEGLGLPVHLAGRVESSHIQDRLLDCDVIVLLSDYEGLPIALMEGMACGCVPVCLRIRSGIPELVEDGVTGLLVSDREGDFVNAIRRLRNEPGLWERLSKGARAKIENGYSVQSGAIGWAKLLEELRDSSGPKRPISVPERIKLPPSHPGFADQDPRSSTPLSARVYRRARMAAGRWRRRMLGQPVP
jgi:colanic acid/amylovoran biosynthesis glycosyltransferase